MEYSMDVNSDEFVKFYNREKLKHAKRKRLNSDFKIVKRIVSEICREVKNGLIESEGGVLMKGWGYFYVNRSFGKVLHYRRENGVITGLDMNFANGGYRYNLIFLPRLDGPKSLSGWSFDYMLTDAIWYKIKDNLRKGLRYKAFPFTVLRLKLI